MQKEALCNSYPQKKRGLCNLYPKIQKRTENEVKTILCKRRIYAFRAHKQKEVHVIAEP